MPKCGYCGNYHSYSTEMCKDLYRRGAGQKADCTQCQEATRAAEHARIREGAVERAAKELWSQLYKTSLWNTTTEAEREAFRERAARIVDAVLGDSGKEEASWQGCGDTDCEAEAERRYPLSHLPSEEDLVAALAGVRELLKKET
jgi:hypothetical protein